MIYDPRRRALELRQGILESMTAEELQDYLGKENRSDTVRRQREERDEPDVRMFVRGQGFPDALGKLIDDDIGNTGDVAFRKALANLLKSHVTRFGPKTYVDLHCEVSVECRGHNE